MVALAGELPLFCCKSQQANSRACTHCSRGVDRNRSETICFSSYSSALRSKGPVVSSTGRWLPLSGDLGGRRGKRGGVTLKVGARRAVVVQGAMGQVKAEKPNWVVLEPITGEAHFDQILSEAQERKQPIIIDWVAAWCRKCIYLKPKLEKLAAEYHPDIKFYFVDVNTVPQSLVKRAMVMKMPTIQLWKEGKWVAEVIGGHQAWLVMDEIREMIAVRK